MKKMRKIISLIVALAFLFSIAAPAMAAEPTAAEKAGNRLLALKIIEGYTDGTLGLDKQITRAEIAVILAKASGMATAADMLKDTPSKFSDVKVGEWYTGWINLAASQGWVKGDPQGTFRPNDPVSYREIVTMVMKILGYNDNLPGDWPTDYLAKAASLGITKGISFDSKAPAVRGDVFTMTSKALDTEVVTWDADKSDFVSKDGKPTLLEDKQDVTKYDDVRVTEVPRVNSDLKENQLKIGNKKYTLLEGDPMAYFGKEVDIWVNDDDEIVAIQVATSSDDIIYDSVSVNVDNEFDLKVKDKSYKAYIEDDGDFTDTTVYVNNEKATNISEVGGTYGMVVLDDNGKVVFANLFDFDGVDAGYVTGIEDTEITYYEGEDDQVIDLDDYDAVYAYNPQFQAVDTKDIHAGDVIYTWENEDDELFMIVVTGNTVSGKLERAKEDKVKVDGKEYDLVSATISSNNDDDIYDYAVDGNDVDSLLGETVTLVLDVNGDVRHIRGDAEATSGSMYGIATDAYRNGGKYVIEIFNKEGKTVAYTTEETADGKPFSTWFEVYNDSYVPVAYELNKAGEIKDGTIKVVAESGDFNGYFDDMLADSVVKISGMSFDDDDDYINVGSNYYYIDSKDTVIMKYEGTDDEELVSWAEIEGSTVAADVYAYVLGTSGKDADFVVFYSNYDSISDDALYAVVLDKAFYDGDDWYLSMDVAGQGEKEYKIAKEVRSDYTESDILVFKVNASGEITDFTAGGGTTYTDSIIDIQDAVDSSVYKTIDDKSGSSVKISGTYLKIASDAVIYSVDSDGDIDKKLTSSKLKKGDKVLYVADDNLIKVILVVNEMLD